MSEIIKLTEAEAADRMIYLSSTPSIPRVDDYQRRVARPLKLSAGAPTARPAPRSAAAGPKTLAEAIRAEVLAGAGENAGAAAAHKFPALVRAWARGLEAARE